MPRARKGSRREHHSAVIEILSPIETARSPVGRLAAVSPVPLAIGRRSGAVARTKTPVAAGGH